MALLTDGPGPAIADLQAHDSSILDTARTEGIELTKKIEVARRELDVELSVFLLRSGDGVVRSLNGDIDLRKVVVTAGLERWHVLKSLAATYCDAYNSQLNDRFLGRWKHYDKLSREAGEALFEVGVGVVRDPVARPSVPTVTAAGPAGGSAVWTIQVAYRNAFGGFSASSDAVHYLASAGTQPVIRVSGAPAAAAGWDVYIGVDSAVPQRQNASMLALNVAWQVAGSGPTGGPLASPGQTPDYFVRRSRVLPRG
jgi:hypothetical protein